MLFYYAFHIKCTYSRECMQCKIRSRKLNEYLLNMYYLGNGAPWLFEHVQTIIWAY